jgi:protein-L-isoaspartate(D-aspartate) O-methyltransferase
MTARDPRDGRGMTSPATRERLVQRLREQGVRDVRVLERIRDVPRHRFVDEALASRAYEDTALPIGHGQTISQPYIVARMTEWLLVDGVPDTVLEVGTGCGYQTAVLAGLVPKVYSVERIEPLLTASRARLRALGLRNVRMQLADGGWGWEAHAPYPAIIVTAAPERLPEGLVAQLAEDGRMVIPLGPNGAQVLTLVRRRHGQVTSHPLEPVSFVPLLGGVVR